MPNIKQVQPSIQQRMRQYSGEISSELSQIPVSQDELQEMQSYRDYLNEVYSPEAAIRRAKRRREYEAEQRKDYEDQKEEEFVHNISLYGAQYGVPRDIKSSAKISDLNDKELREELFLQYNERKNYMPDSVFERIINKQSEANFKPIHLDDTDDPVITWGVKVNPIAKWLYNTLLDVTYNNYKMSTQAKEKYNTKREFYQYTEQAQRDAWNRYKTKKGITDKDVQQDGKKVIKKHTITPQEQVYNYLTSPEGSVEDLQERVNEIKFDPARNPDFKFGTKGYFKDASTQYLINLNEALMRSFSGRIDRTGEIVARGQDAVKYYENEEELREINKNISDIEAYLRTILTTAGENGADAYREYNLKRLELVDKKRILEEENAKLEKSKNIFEEYLPTDFVDRALLTGTKLLSDLENKVFGTRLYDFTSPIFDDSDALRENLYGFATAETAQLKNIYLQKYILERNKKIKQWQEGIDANKADKDRVQDSHKISEYFKYWEQHASGNILSGDTWAFKQPGLMGYSNSGWIKQLPMYIGAVAAPWLGAAGVAASAAAGFVGGHSAAYDENFMELRENFVPVVKRELQNAGDGVYDTFILGGLNYVDPKTIKEGSDEEIDKEVINAFLDGKYKPRTNVQSVYEAVANASHGLNALFDRDMMAVDFDNFMNTAILFGNYAKLGKLTKFIKPAENPISPVVGISNLAFKLTPAGKKVYKMVDDATTFMTTIPEKIYNKAKQLAPDVIKTPRARKLLNKIEKSATLAEHPGLRLAARTGWQNTKQVTKAAMLSGFSEGVEEGKQWLHGQEYQRGEFEDESVGFGLGFDWKKWYDDMTDGLYSAYVIAGIPFGLEYTHDPELVENIKGGMMGGLFQTGVTSFGQQLMRTPQMLKLNKYMLNNVMAEKAARTDMYNKAKLYAAKSFSEQDSQYIRDQFDYLKKINAEARQKDAKNTVDDSIIEEQKLLFESVNKLAKSQEVRDRAELLGFVPGDDKYNEFIAQLTLQQSLFDETTQNKNNIINLIQKEESLIEPIYSLNELTGKIMRKNGSILLPWTGEFKTYEDGTKETPEEAVERLNNLHAQNSIAAIRIKVLKNLLAQLEVQDDSFFGNAKTSKNFLKHRLNNQLQTILGFFKPEYRDLKYIDALINSVPDSENLESLYRKLSLAQVDQDYASMMYQGLMGKYAVHQSQQESTTSPNGAKLDFSYDDPKYSTTFENISKAFLDRIKGDNALYDALEQDYLDRMEKVEQDHLAEAKKVFLLEHPELVEEEKLQNETKPQPQSHITAIDKSTKQQVSYESALKLAKKIKNKERSKKRAIKDTFKFAGIKIDPKYEDVVYNTAKQLVEGKITEHQFANLFVPREQRQVEAPVIETPVEEKKPAAVEKSAEPEKPQETLKPKQPEKQETKVEEEKPLPKPKAPKKPEVKKPEVKKPAEKKAEEKKQEVKTTAPILDKEDAKRFEELAKKFKELTGSIVDNYGDGNDSLIMAAVAEMIFLLVKNGTYSFYDCGKVIINTLGEKARPYLKSAYEGARYWPGSEQFNSNMTSQLDVSKINIVDFDKVDPMQQFKDKLQNFKEQVVSDLLDVLSKYSIYINQYNEANVLKEVFDLLRKLQKQLEDAINNNDTTTASNIVVDIEQNINKFNSTVELLDKKLANEETQQPKTTYEPMPQNKDDQYELWAKSALESLSFYFVKISNGQELTQQEFDTVNQWLSIVKQQIPTLELLSAGNILYETLLNYYSAFEEVGVDGTGAFVQSVINVDEDTSAVRWETLNTMHTKSLDESVATDDDSVYLKQFTSDKDFITEAQFEFVLGGTNKFDGPVKEGYPRKIYAIVTYKGHTFTPVAIWDTTSDNAEEENKGFGQTVRELIESNPDKKIVPLVVKRTKGKTFQQPNGEKVTLQEAGLVDDVYSVSFNNDQEEFMLTRALPVAGGKVLIRATKPNKSGTGVSAVYTYSHDSAVQTAGNVVYMMRIEGSDKPLLPINVFSDTISEGDAQLIVDILCGKYTNGVIGKQAMDMPFVLNGEYLGVNGNEKTIGLTARDVLNLILPYGPFGRKGTDIVHIWHSEFGDSRIILSGKFKGDDVFKNHEFNLSTTLGKEDLKKFLMENVRKNISERVMKSSLGKPSEHKDNPLLGLANFVFSRLGTELRNRLKAGEQIQLGDSSIIFDWDDLGNDKRNGGITGLGWYVKCGFLKTDFAGINNAIISFTGAKVQTDDNTQKPKDQKPTITVAETGGTENKPKIGEQKPEEHKGRRRTVGRVRRNLEKRTAEVSEDTRTIEEVRLILSEIIPSSEEALTVSVSNDFLDDEQVSRLCAVSAAAPHVVGRCYADGIEIYKHAKLGVIYHEAFHRISEIFLDDEERKRVYDRYERFYRISHFGKKPSLDRIREGVADQFMMFMESRNQQLGLSSGNIFKKLFNTIKFIAKIGSYGQYKLYSQIAAGRFKNFKFDEAARKRADNFAAEHPEGYGFTIEGQTFKYILNEHAFKDLVNSLVYFAFHANNIAYDGSNINELAIDKDTIANSEMYQDYTSDDSLGANAIKEAMEHFEIFAPYIVSAISEFATDYKVVIEDQNAEEAQAEDVSSASISEHTHQSYEFSQFSRASSKVRFFFSRIDDLTTKEVDGQAEYVDKLNGLGLPQFIPAKTIFNDVLNLLWDIDDLNDMMNRIAILSKDSPVYEQLYNRLNRIKNNAYVLKYDADEEQLLIQIFNVIKSNKQQFLLSQSSRYYVGGDVVGYTVTLQNTDQEYNARNYRFEWSNLFAHGGSIFVETGEDGKIRPKKGMNGKSMAQYWGLIVNQDPSQKLGIAAAFSSDEQIRKRFYMTVIVDGKSVQKPIDAKNNKLDLDLCKVKFIQILNCFGIQFDKAMLDYMLRQKYGNSGYEGMQQMFEETGVASLSAVTFFMNGTYFERDGKYGLSLDDDGRLNGRRPEEIFAYKKESDGDKDSNGFFGELATYKYLYRHSHDQLSVLAAAGNKYYVISENNYITDTVHFLNKAIKFYQTNDPRLSSQIEEFDELCSFYYNLIEEDEYLKPIGSVILKQILTLKAKNLEVCTLSGMKSDFRGDTGVDYATISRRDDYISKLAILLNGGLIFPTLSDKKTWVFIKGILLPGINWAQSITGADILKFVAHDVVSGQNVVDNHGRIRTNSLFSYALQNKEEVVDQLIEYFITEHVQIRQTLDDIKSLPKERRVSNYHGGAKVKDSHGGEHVVIQGARHSSLLNLYGDNDELIPISRVLDENGEYINEELEWQYVDDLFFSAREDETEEDLRNRQRIYVNRILKHRLEEELQKLEQIGLVRKVGTGDSVFDYENVGIDAAKVELAYKAILSTYGVKEGSYIVRAADGSALQMQDLTDDDVKRFKSLALATVVNDGMVKAIMSKNETERIFSGHPSFFKWGYDEHGNLVDIGVDQHKRAGGLVSTGQNAALWARGVNGTYTSSEIDNEMLQSEQMDLLQSTIYEGTLRSTLINYLLDEAGYSLDDNAAKDVVQEIDSLETEQVKERLQKISKELNSDILYLAEKRAKEKIDDFRKDSKNKGIDVADGAAYVTDTFFELMLRSVGEWNSKIERAFKILRGEEVDGKVYTIKDITTVAEATEAVYTAVIGTQKYTAYGQRMQKGWDAEDGHHDGNTLIPYYDKFALFPLFKIICTGKMAHVYKAMKDLKVDMLKIKSATKLGNEGSLKLDWSEWTDAEGNVTDNFHNTESGFKFNVYQQRMKYLRKLFNTDPKEKEFLTMGTQMTKVVMQALTPGRTYITQDGKKMSAKELRDDVMAAMNEIARIGDEKFRKEFFNSDGELNLKAFANLIKDELSRRGASRDVIDGFTVVKENGKDVFKISPSAQSDISWIQSILASVVNKRIVDINTPGNLFIQRSVWGMEGVTSLFDDEDLPQSINGGRKLQLINEEGSMDCVLSIDYFENIIPKIPVRDSKGRPVYKTDENEKPIYKYDEDGNIKFDSNGNPIYEVEMRKMSFAEAKQWLIDNEIISGIKTGEHTWNNAKANIVGYRIPTQAVSSIHAFRCVDVLPVVRDTVIMPAEITKVTGSDFDVDKMFLSMLNYKVTGRKARDYDFISSLVEYHQNKLIKDQIAMLLNKDEYTGVVRNVLQLHGSIDKDTKLLTDTLDELESEGIFKERLTYQDYVLSNEVFIKQDFITGKNGIGPFALNNNNHVLTMLYGVRFRKDKKSILTRLNLNRLDRTVDRDGNSILSWLSGLINAHVDIAKDPYISRLGVNPFTYNMVNLLIRTGLGKYTFYFLTQPIIMLLAEAYTNAGGVCGVDRTKTVSQLRRESKERFITQYINQNMGTNFSEYEYKDAMASWEKRMKDFGININQAIDYLFNSKTDILKKVSKQYKTTGDKLGSVDIQNNSVVIENKYGHSVISMFDLQMLAFEAFEQFEPYAQALSSVVKYSKIDTKKQGKNITEQRAFRLGVINTFVNPRGLRRMFNNNLYKMYNESYIRQKTDLALSAFEDLLSNQLIQATPQFERQLNMMFEVLNKSGERLTEDLIGDISDAMIQQIKSRYINDYAKRNNIDIKGLVSGDNTIFDRLVKLQIAIKTEDKYSDLLVDGEIQNYLLSSLVTALQQEIRWGEITKKNGQEDTYKNAKFVKLLNFLEDDLMDSDQLRSDWDVLLNDGTYPEILLFARDLVVYSFITTGDLGGGMRNLFKFVPNSWKLGVDGGNESYNDYMRRVLEEYNNGTAPSIDIEDLILNNWRNYNFVPTYSISKKNGFRFLTYYPEGFDFPIIISGLTVSEEGEVMYPTFNEDPDSESYYPSPKYLKIKRANEDIDESSQRVYNIYKRISFGIYTDEAGETHIYPIYVLVGPKGNTFKGNYRILEYGRQDQSYNEVAIAAAKDPLIRILLKYTKQEYTDVESLLALLSNALPIADLLLQVYNEATGMCVNMDEVLRSIVRGYSEQQDITNAGGRVIHAKYSRSTVEKDPQNMYIFTDNTDRTSGSTPIDENSWYSAEYGQDKQLFYPSKTTAQIRGLNNAYPISTQKYYNDEKRGISGRWEDADYDILVEVVEKELKKIQDAWFSGNYKNIVMPTGNGFVDSSISAITKERTPKLYEYFTNVEKRIVDMVENNVLLVEEKATFTPGQHPTKTLLKYAFNNTFDMLQHVQENSSNDIYKLIAGNLMQYAKDNSVTIKYTHAGEESYVAQYLPNDNVVLINLDNPTTLLYQDEILLHETLHSLTSKYLNSNKDAADKIMQLADYVKSKISEFDQETLGDLNHNLDRYFRNAKEFITYATTDVLFRSLLERIEAMDQDKYKSIFEELLDNIKDIIYKIMGNPDKSVIDQIDPVVDKILKLQYENISADGISELKESDEIQKPNEYGHFYGWSVLSIGDHLRSFIKDAAAAYNITGGIKSRGLYNYISAHVKEINKIYGTNFGVYLDSKTNEVKIRWNSVPESELRLTENPNAPKLLELFDNFEIKNTLKQLGELTLKDCGY